LGSFIQIVSDPSSTSEKVILFPKELTGFLAFGPYTYLLQGSYEVTFELKLGPYRDNRIGWCDVSVNLGNSTVAEKDIFGSETPTYKWANYTVTFNSTKFMTGVEFRAYSFGTADIYLDRIIVKRVAPYAAGTFG
jgi:hypothetical protein